MLNKNSTYIIPIQLYKQLKFVIFGVDDTDDALIDFLRNRLEPGLRAKLRSVTSAIVTELNLELFKGFLIKSVAF